MIIEIRISRALRFGTELTKRVNNCPIIALSVVGVQISHLRLKIRCSSKTFMKINFFKHLNRIKSIFQIKIITCLYQNKTKINYFCHKRTLKQTKITKSIKSTFQKVYFPPIPMK